MAWYMINISPVILFLKMFKFESSRPSDSKIFRQDMYTWWKREQYMSFFSPNYGFSRQMAGFYPAHYPIGIWNPWSFNMGMNNVDYAVYPGFERDVKFNRSSKKNDKTSIPSVNKISEQGFQAQGPRHTSPFHRTSFQHGQFSPRRIPPPVHPSYFHQNGQLSPSQIPPPVHPSCFKQQGNLGRKQIIPAGRLSDYKQKEPVSKQITPPVQSSYRKPYKNSFNNSNNNTSKNQVCRLCIQNGEDEEFYSNHQLKDRNGKVTCPILRKLTCEICNATGDFAHTKAYCPLNKEKNKKPLAVMLKQTWHDSSGRIRK